MPHHHRVPRRLLPLLTLALLPSVAPAAGWLALGGRYSRDLAVQQAGSLTALDTAAVTRRSVLLSGAWGRDAITAAGGWAVDAQGSLDHAPADGTTLSYLQGRAHWLRPLTERWLGRLSLEAARYRDDVYPVSGYDAGVLRGTLGWFGDGGQGVDLVLGLQREDHDQDPADRYRTRRLSLAGTWYLPAASRAPRWRLFGQWRRSDADDPARDYDSGSLGLGLDRLALGRWRLGLTAQYRADRYRASGGAAVAGSGADGDWPGGSGGDGGPDAGGDDGDMGPGGHPGGMGRAADSTDAMAIMAGGQSGATRRDRYLSLAVDLQRPLGGRWSLTLSAEGGRYETNQPDSTRTYLVLEAGLRRALP